MWKLTTVSAVILLAVSSCTWVKLSHNGDNVRVVATSEVQGCKSIGQTKVSVRDTFVGDLKRDEGKVARELMTLGRNSAAEMGGDTLTVASEVINGERSFSVYKCMP
ncbi:MAG: DUF4156 domain-containing protein [Proteobacteria bacterium]|nr:DUF4156 domain-containing protein [Pseudomonadota bacterium]MDP2106357.1 DUF4156 domain-containing protein [Desulfobulbaceae bacterium]